MPRSTALHPYARRLQRLLTIINEIKTTPHQTPKALYASLGISRAMFYKDCQVLKDLGLVFHYDRPQRRYIITQDRYLPVLDLSTSEMLALIMAVRQIASTGDHTLTYEAIAALRKVVSNTPAEVRAFLKASLDDVVLQDGFGCNPTILHDLWNACQEHQRLCIVYDRGDGPREWVIDPYQLFFKRRALYLDACVVETRQVHMFRVNRIKSLALLGVRMPSPLVPYNFRERHRHSFSVFVGTPPQRVRIRFRQAVRQYITETRWHASQQIDDLPDSSFIFTVEVSEPREVGWWVLQWGANAEVLEPESLRQELAETARALVAVYEK
jgi:predicted DNA-binding transcriptional regulator YafY